MSCGLTTGRTSPCNDNQGGVRALYFAAFVEYDHTQILGQRGVEITQFPATTFYKWDFNECEFNEEINNDEDGIWYDQTLTLTFNHKDKDIVRMQQLTKAELRYIVEYNNGKFRMGGVWNGARVENYTITTGGAKASFYGYDITIKSKDRFQAPFLASLEIPDIEEAEILLLEDLTAILLEDETEILLE